MSKIVEGVMGIMDYAMGLGGANKASDIEQQRRINDEFNAKMRAFDFDQQKKLMFDAVMQGHPVPKPAPKPWDPNKEPAMQVSLSALRDLWAAKHGDQWTTVPQRKQGIAEDNYWHFAWKRLEAAGMFEIIMSSPFSDDVGLYNGPEMKYLRLKEF